MIVEESSTYGICRVTKQLRRTPYVRVGLVVNRKRAERMMRKMGLRRPMKHRGCQTTNSERPYPWYSNLVDGLVVTYPD